MNYLSCLAGANSWKDGSLSPVSSFFSGSFFIGIAKESERLLRLISSARLSLPSNNKEVSVSLSPLPFYEDLLASFIFF